MSQGEGDPAARGVGRAEPTSASPAYGRDKAESAPRKVGDAPIRIVLTDDQEFVRAGFRVLLERCQDLEVVGEAANGAEAVQLARTQHPDVVLMDIRMPLTARLGADVPGGDAEGDL